MKNQYFLFSLICIATPACARWHDFHDLNDIWSDMEIMMREQQEDMARIKNQVNHFVQNQSDTIKLPKFETVKFPAITSQVTQDDNAVLIKVTLSQPAQPKQADTSKQESKEKELSKEEFTLTKEKIEVTPEDNMLEVFIPLAKSFVRIQVNRHNYAIVKGVQSKQETDNSFSSNTYERLVKSDTLPALVAITDTKNIKAIIDEKTNTLTITLPKKKTAKIPVTVQ